jgi:DNA-binding beta-propeller fold protein YncE
MGVVIIAVAAAAASAAVLLSRSDPVPTVVPNSLVKIDPRSNEVVEVIHVGRFPGKVASGNGFIWVVNIEDETVTRVPTRSGPAELVAGLRVEQPTGLSADDARGVFVGSFAASEVVRVNPSTLQVEERLRLPGETASFVASGGGSLWVTQPPVGFQGAIPSAISRVSILNDRVERRFAVPVGVLPGQIAFGAGAAWVANVGDGTVWRIDAATNRIKRIQVGSQPTDIAIGFDSVWVPCLGRNSVWRLDAATGKVEAIIPTGDESLALAAGADAPSRGSTRARTGS